MICWRLTALLWILLERGIHAQPSAFEWSCSSLDEDTNTFSLPDLALRNEQIAGMVGSLLPSTPTGLGHVYPIPPTLNCNGIVTAIEFCYAVQDSQLNTDVIIFTFLTLQQNGLNFTVTDIFVVASTPTSEMCTPVPGPQTLNYCCDTLSLDLTSLAQFPLPMEQFAFGIVPTFQLLRYNPAFPPGSSLQAEQFTFMEADADNMPRPGRTYSFSETDRQTNEALRLINFLITPDQEIPTSEGRTLPGQSTTTTVESTSATTATPPASASFPLGAVVGAIIGVLAAIIILVVIIVVCVLARRQCSRKSKKTVSPADANRRSYQNGIYYGADDQENSVKYDYAGVGPNTFSDIRQKFPFEYEVPEDHEYSYATDAAMKKNEDGLDNPEYSYAQTGAGIKKSNTYEAVAVAMLPPHREGPEQEQNLTSWTGESIYMVPGTDENTLYAQLDEILTDNVPRSSVKLGNFLGSGQFGKVHRGVWHSTTGEDVDVAVKTLKEGSDEQDRIKFLQEAAIMGQFKHPNVVTMYGVVTEGEPVLLVIELLSKGDLRNHLLKMRSEGGVEAIVDSRTLLSYCRQVASGMAYLSSKAFVHRDLAARNILVSDDEICKIADFGMSRDLMDESYYVSHGGQIPVKWTAPEALHYKKYSTASDVWSYGAVVYEIWSVGFKPFKNYTNNQVLKLVDTGFRLPPPPGCPRALYSIMISCWHPMTTKRPSFADVSDNLSLPDTELLKWSEEDKSTHPGADKLGADLLLAQDLYRDLQDTYKTSGR